MEEQIKEQQLFNYGVKAGTIGRVIDVSAPDDSGAVGWRFDAENHVITIFSPSDYTLTGVTAENRIVVHQEEGYTSNFNLILQDLDINLTSEQNNPPIMIMEGILCRILLYGNSNQLHAGENAAALNIKYGSDLEIDDLVPDTNAYLSLNGGTHAACLGANNMQPYGNIKIKSGHLSFTAQSNGSGIGYGDFNNEVQGSNGDIIITGGDIQCFPDPTAIYQDGIRCKSLNISGGSVSLNGSNQGSGIAFINQNIADYEIKISDNACVYANGGFGCPGINLYITDDSSRLIIDGGRVYVSGNNESGIGLYSRDANVKEGIADIIINNGYVQANGNANGSGIGSKSLIQIGKIVINGGTIYAYGGVNGSGIGSKIEENKTTIVINGGDIEAHGGTSSAGICTKCDSSTEAIIINGGKILAKGGTLGAGIGTSHKSDASNILINNGVVLAYGGRCGAGIGSGSYGNASKIIIRGGLIKAYGCEGGAGIGGGYRGNVEEILISSNASVVAESGEEYTYDIGNGRKGNDYYSGLYTGFYTGHYSGEIDGIYQGILSGSFKGTVYREYSKLIDATFNGQYTGKAKGTYSGFFKGRFSGYRVRS